MRRFISTLAGLLLIGATSTNAFAADIETVWDHGMPVSLARIGYTYNSYIMPSSLTTKKLDNGTRVEALDMGDVDQMRRACEPLLHDRHQRMTAGDHLGVLVLGEQIGGLPHRARTMIFEFVH